MQKEVIVIPGNIDFNIYEEKNIKSFILPLEGYSIGFDKYYSIDEINNLSLKYNIYVIMNKFLHKKIENVKDIIDKFNSNIKFIIEDIGLLNIIDRKRIILYENHIISNYKAINYLDNLGINSVVVNNDLTINELKEISDKTNSNLYYFYIAKNMIMYSRRNLVSNYNKHFNLEDTNKYLLEEKVSHKKLEIKEEDGSVVRYNKIFCASKYINELTKYNFIIDFSNINEEDTLLILDNLNNKDLCNLIDSDYYFLENDIKYKVGDL